MKLQCQVEVINTTQSNLNLRRNSKYVKSTLALGREPKGDDEFFILHFSTVNKSGTKYRVKNIKQVFVKYINDGKSTIRFNDPPHDLCIKSESLQLKCFLRMLKSCLSGDGRALKLAPFANLSVTVRDQAPTKLIIKDRSEFPSKGFPRSLESLYMCGLKLCNFRREILMLKHLTILDLSQNEIERLPVDLGRMPNLSELYLQNNQLGSKQNVDWRWLHETQIAKTLKLLDLRSNQLKHIPNSIWKLQKLVTLRLDNNQLHRLPSTIGRLRHLKYFTASQNKLESMPNSLLHCSLESIDVSRNRFQNIQIRTSPCKLSNTVKSLVNIAAKVILNHKVFYAPNSLPRCLVQYLDEANMCRCGGPTLNNEINFYKYYDLKDYVRVVEFDFSSLYNRLCCSIKFEYIFCSQSCYKNFIEAQNSRALRGGSV